ncbi:SGNH/GDSL hydrolase family protein [soil metagenome]
MILVAMAALAGLLSAKEPSPCIRGLCGAESLAPYFAALSNSRGPGARAVHILELGDSHSAGDSITGPWRDILQARFGSAGRGVLPPGRPFDGFIPHGVHVEQSPGWSVENIYRAPATAPATATAYGVSGFRLTSRTAGAQISLTAEPVQAFRRLTVCADAEAGTGAYVMSVGQVRMRVQIDGSSSGVQCESLIADTAQVQASVQVDSGTVTLTSWASFADAGGVAVSNLGVVGAELRHFARNDDHAVRQEFDAYRPDLIVLEFGTNDGFVGRFDAGAFESRLREQIARLQRLSGGAPILVIGAPDAETTRPELTGNAAANTAANCAKKPVQKAAVIGKSSTSKKPASRKSSARSKKKPAPKAVVAKTWFSPPALAQVRAIQRRVTREMDVAFWDWGARMGGPGAADEWATANPPLMRADRVHTTTAGGAKVAAMLQADLDEAFTLYQASR